jgi:enamine deaminase RidA (YjgF/YER057c/UK114 family)
MSRVAERLAEAGHAIPSVAVPLASYVPARRTAGAIYVSGQLPFLDGVLPMTGLVGVDVTPEQAHDLARISALNAIAALASVIDLDEIRGIVKVTGFVACRADFTAQPAVINGASELFAVAFGDAGRHARSAVGVAALPMNAPVEVEVIAEI